MTLPAGGYQGEIPKWPLNGQSHREAEVWEAHWRKPQASQWIAEQLEWNVAFYVRRFVEAEEVGSSANLSTLVKQLAEDLGLTKAGMDRNRWRISSIAPAPDPEPDGATVSPIESAPSARDRYKGS